MKPDSKQKAFIPVLALILGTAGGFGGGYLQDRYLSAPLSSNANTPIETETLKEILPESAVTAVADKFENSVVSVVASKEVEYVLNQPFFYFNTPDGSNPFQNDPFFQEFFSQNGLNQPQSDSENSGDSNSSEKKTEKQQIAAGTGFVITSDGMILTNKHVVSDEEAEYTVTFADGTDYSAEVVTRDPTNDLAVLQIKDAGDATFTPVEFVSTKDDIIVGEFVVAIGNALGEFQNSITLGVVSAKNRSLTAGDMQSSENLKELIQTDAAINPGNSGGPLVNLSGKVIGINTAIASSAQSIGFSIPLDQSDIDTILSQIAEYGEIVKPYLGVRYINITPEINKENQLGTDQGAWLKGQDDLPAVVKDTPAADAGLKGGDIVLKVNSTDITTENDLSTLLSDYNPNDEITLTILRDGKEQDIKVTLGKWEE